MQQQIELKAVLPNKGAFDRIVTSFNGNMANAELQENHFYDSYEGEVGDKGSYSYNGRLHDRGASLRLRIVRNIYGQLQSAVLTMKDHCSYEGGSVSRWATRNAPLSAEQTNVLLANTTTVGQLLNAALVSETTGPIADVARAVSTILGSNAQLSHLNHVGSFHTSRLVLQWTNATSQTGLIIHLDHTRFPHTAVERFELEVPNIEVPVQDVLEELSQALHEMNIQFELGTESKYQVFLRNLPRAGQAASHMSNDLKMVFEGQSAYDAVCASFTPEQTKSTVAQISYFFDTPDSDLAKKHNTVFRIRQDTKDGKSETTAALKEQQAVNEGQNFCWSQEHAIPADLLQAMISGDPSCALQYSTFPVVAALVNKLNVRALKYIGHISNVRRNYVWTNSKSQPGLSVRLDHTTFPHCGVERFELEVPNIEVPVHDVLEELSQVLRDEMGIPFELGTESKFQVLLRTLPSN